MYDYPRKIILFRHAEKSTRDGDQGLSPVGRRRAEFIREFVLRNFGQPDYIFTPAPDRESLRPLLTVLPLWQGLEGVLLDASFQRGTEMELSGQITGFNLPGGKTGSEGFAGKNIVICWYREVIPMFMKALGAAAGDCRRTRWSENVFSSV